MVSYRDPIHGDLLFTGVTEEIILTEEFQRLTDVKQLGLTDKVYPGANHTRFSHALGSCFIAGEIAKRLNVPAEDRLLIQVAALLHDVGHYDFSHALEHLAPATHEENGKSIILGKASIPNRKSGQIAAVLKKHHIAPERIIALLHKEGTFPPFYYSILSSPIIDCDRIDYLKRDTYYTGAVIGEIDVSRLLGVLMVHPKTKELGIMQKGAPSLEQFIVARMHMYQQVYFHPQTDAAETMLYKAVQSSINIASPLMYGDEHLLARLSERGSPLTKRLIERIRAGKSAYYQPALIVDATGSAKHLLKHIPAPEKAAIFEQKIISRLKLKEGDVLVSLPGSHRPPMKKLPRFPVQLHEGEWADFFDIAPIAKAAMMENSSKIALVVYSPPEHAEKVRQAALSILS